MRTHTNGELNDSHVDNEVVLCGWVHSRRDHGGILFIDLRDRYGMTQIVLDPQEVGKEAEQLRREDVIKVAGKVRLRPEGMENPNIVTGKIEVLVSKLDVLNKSETPPIEVDDRIVPSDEVRLKYRFLDLRRPVMQENLRKRHVAAQAARDYLSKQNFLEVETPMLVRATPEGARDYVVPSRVNAGKFYALPQSPQLYKQILMVSGVDRYFQFPRCLRDEDLRTDRQPEHTQIDLEISFPTVDIIFGVVEGLMQAIWKQTIGYEVKTPFPRIPFDESMAKYGTDKPDIRFELFLTDVSEIAKESDFSVFSDTVKNGGMVKCINPQKDYSRKELDAFIAFCQQAGAKGMAYMKVTDKGLDGSISKYFNEDVQKKLIEATGAQPGSTLMFIADKPKIANEVLAKLRNELGKQLELYDPKEFAFCWTVDFPLFEWDDDEDKWTPAHHLFCMPNEEDVEKLESDPGNVKCSQYDLVLNGVELCSGSIRITDGDIQKRVMKVIGITEKEAEKKFGFLLEAFKYGAPPHGGVGIGFDRIVALICGTNDIREVIAFPKNKAAQCPMDGSPSDVDDHQLKELNIKVDVPKK